MGYDSDLWLGAQHYAESRAGIYAFIPHNSPMREVLAWPFYRWQSWSSQPVPGPITTYVSRLGRRDHDQERRRQPPPMLSSFSGRCLLWEHVSCLLLVGPLIWIWSPWAWKDSGWAGHLGVIAPHGSSTSGLALEDYPNCFAFHNFLYPKDRALS